MEGTQMTTQTPIKDALIENVEKCRENFNTAILGTVEHNEAMRDLGKALRILTNYSGEPEVF